MKRRRSTVRGMTARDKFAKGDRVKLSAAGLEHLGTESRNRFRAHDSNTRGTVVGFAHSPEAVGIVRDGHKTRDVYHLTFWEVE